MKLRYYTDTRDNYLERTAYILDLLQEIDQSIIPVEIVDTQSQKDIYENDMKPQTRVIKENTGRTAADHLKSNSGNLHVYGTLALVENRQVQWIAKYSDVVTTLEAIVDEQVSPDELVDSVASSPEREKDIIDAFVQSDVLTGTFEREVEVGIDELRRQYEAGEIDCSTYNQLKSNVARRVDLVCQGPDADWVIEAKKSLNIKAIGQVVMYRWLYKQEIADSRAVNAAVVTGAPSSSMEAFKFQRMSALLDDFDVNVYIKGDNFE
jgi:hypothetical protein